ncbi:arabinogalactan endo-1,4-beta-galactosidase [Butyrivibrio fibrisolvens DSM 3071]|uniref:Arabinogalactan endo-beta-1,4-galactanase n=1 Tax=Butyrivibrio fibrisolvens DSM 3071 TaxID=1121131 RepID=A0A1M5Z0G8_BUTFI|nr:glycosyl hydrolase 53 family protein [Butyrivibrio fibrisolvens]SHI17792.1 arabinogalactan endo-1,4-beta-galactosidase [Butyrivibrio fibrisolvens DSM 3071]
MVKKLTSKISFLLAISLSALSLSACSNNNSSQSENGASASSASTESISASSADTDSSSSNEDISDNTTSDIVIDDTEAIGIKTVDSNGDYYKDKQVYVQKIDGLSEDFMRGVDISSFLSEIESGVVFKDYEGNDIDSQGFFDLLADSGVNYVRIRVWNDPYDENGNGYGGGNCDIDRAISMGEYATNAGMKVYIDFHYSDFWADPNKQMCPKAWEGMSISEKETTLYDYTKESLEKLKDAGVDVGLVAVGNETDSGMAGVTSNSEKCKLYSAGSKAVREVFPDAYVAVHYSNPQRDYMEIAKMLDDTGVDYDVFATSYYPYWHGTLENLTDTLKNVADTYGKKVMVAETSWAYTLDDGDGSGNTVGKGSNDDSSEYSISVQGQSEVIRNVIKAVADVGDAGIGMFYWEPAWIPVNVYADTTDNASDTLKANSAAWEKYGAGWASSYASVYDPDDAGQYYGGSSWDNQALFDFAGYPLYSLKTFGYVYEGNEVEGMEFEGALTPSGITVSLGEDISLYLPKTVKGEYTGDVRLDLPVEWDDYSNIKEFGEYKLFGTVTDILSDEEDNTSRVIIKITVLPESLLENSDFETGDDSGWLLEGNGPWVDTEDVYRGEYGLHFWSQTAVEFTATQTYTAIHSGNYTASMMIQGGDAGDDQVITITVTNETKGTSVTAETKVTGWLEWTNPTTDVIEADAGDILTVTIYVKGASGAWGTIDDAYLYIE